MAIRLHDDWIYETVAKPPVTGRHPPQPVIIMIG